MLVTKEYKKKLLKTRDGDTSAYEIDSEHCLGAAAAALDEHDDQAAIAWALVGLLTLRMEQDV